MKLAIMQPYIFPYLGYYQLISAVDMMIIYDDVNFIKQGWINRNRILVNDKPHIFTVPLTNISSFVNIKDTHISEKQYSNWRDKFIKTLVQNYKKAPYFEDSIEVVSEVLNINCISIADLASMSVIIVSKFLGLNTKFKLSSTSYDNDCLKGQNRVLDICLKEGAVIYLNSIGGYKLYSKEEFKANGVDLRFIKPNLLEYIQFDKDKFVPSLSIIDSLMFNGREGTSQLLKEYSFI